MLTQRRTRALQVVRCSEYFSSNLPLLPLALAIQGPPTANGVGIRSLKKAIQQHLQVKQVDYIRLRLDWCDVGEHLL